MARKAKLFVLSGPSGAGKGTVLSRVLKQRPELHLTVSATTRKPREGEIVDVSYHYLSDEEFDALVEQGAFLEWANVHDHRYGTLNEEVDPYLADGHSVVLEIDVQGAFAVREKRPDAILLFIEPPSMEVLEQRLRDRKSEDEDQLRLRLHNAIHEMELAPRYDARIVNDDLDDAVKSMVALIDHYENDGGSDQDGSH